MGCAGSHVERSDTKEDDHKPQPKTIMILGPHYSGKTTIVRHFQIVYGELKKDLVRRSMAPFVKSTVLEHVRTLFHLLQDYEYVHPKGIDQTALDAISRLKIEHEFKLEDAEYIMSIWENEVLAPCVQDLGSTVSVSDLTYMIRALVRVMAANFQPSDEDILRCQWQSVGISETEISNQDVDIRFLDVGGQLHERRKWKALYAEHQLTGLIFVVALDSFYKAMAEDESKNRMLDSLELFGRICQEDALKSIHKIIVLNKVDLFHSDLREHFLSFKDIFPEYDGDGETKSALEHVRSRFVSISKDANQQVIFASAVEADDNGPLKTTIEKFIKHIA